MIAVGTSVVRALESAAQLSGGADLRAASGITDLLVGPGGSLAVVDALLTGVHESNTTHFMLLRAFASLPVLEAALATAAREGFLGHELGDAWLVWSHSQRRSCSAPARRFTSSATFAA